MTVRFVRVSFSRNRTFSWSGTRFFSINGSRNSFKKNRNNFEVQGISSGTKDNKKFSTDSDNKKDSKNVNLPPLMNFPRVIWPSILKSFKNTFLTQFIIRPYMDHEFDLREFVLGSQKAVHVVSKRLALGEDLDELVTDDIAPTLESRLSIMSEAQKEWLTIQEEDIYFSFPYQVGIIYDDENDKKRFVEILMVHHSLKGLGEMKVRGEEIPLNIGFLPEYRNKICIANYRFIREYTKGVKDNWTINRLNHFKPSDAEEVI